ncbi:MAG: hypothetical protein KatS3mg087_0599 [Patescibacteria group bacterium]|nr:MAG: hypothetical protein KatS3mg087_0599 [Patescibacteria group bacterium]
MSADNMYYPASETLAQTFLMPEGKKRAELQLEILKEEFPEWADELKIKNMVWHKLSPHVFKGDRYLWRKSLTEESRKPPYIPSHFGWETKHKVKPFSE